MGGVILYKGYKSAANRVRRIWKECHSLGTIYRNGSPALSSRLLGSKEKIFKTMKEAEAYGLELAREWVDQNWLEGITYVVWFIRRQELAAISAGCRVGLSEVNPVNEAR